MREQHVAVLVVAKILGHGECRVPYPEAAAWWFVHLTEHHHHVLEHAGGEHVAVQLLAFATALADTAENAHPLLGSYDVMNHLGEEHRLTDPSSPE